jgi:hypothetical protein
MTLFEFPSQHREKMAIWRIFSEILLYGPLAEGHIFRWFAFNIPMDLLTGGKFNSDIDAIACLRPDPVPGVQYNCNELFYKTWELKVTLLNKDGTTSSLKAGKTSKTLKQLQAYRNFGSPDVSLLEAYICEPGFLHKNMSTPEDVEGVMRERFAELNKNGFGYRLLLFEHAKDGDMDVGLLTPRFGRTSAGVPETSLKLLSPIITQPRDPFCLLVRRLNEFFDSQGRVPNSLREKIVFCRACHRLALIRMIEQDPHDPALSYHRVNCPYCSANLVVQ